MQRNFLTSDSFGKLQIFVGKVRSIILALNEAAASNNNAEFSSYVNFQTFTFVLYTNKHTWIRVSIQRQTNLVKDQIMLYYQTVHSVSKYCVPYAIKHFTEHGWLSFINWLYIINDQAKNTRGASHYSEIRLTGEWFSTLIPYPNTEWWSYRKGQY
jgi:hypothetical protein